MPDEHFQIYLAAHKGKFESMFDYLSKGGSEISFGSVFHAHYFCHELLEEDLLEEIYFLLSGCIPFQLCDSDYEVVDDDGNAIGRKPVTENTSREDMFQELIRRYREKKRELYMVYMQYANQLNKKEECLIEEFPEGADNHDKEILKKLVKEHLIFNYLLPEGKYEMLGKRRGRAIAQFLLNNGVNQNWGPIFMDRYIKHDVDRSTITNYFRELPKDMSR